MRIIIGTVCGAVIGALMVIDFLGFEWCPGHLFSYLNFPADLLLIFLFHWAGWFGIVISLFTQWLIIGLVVGFIWHRIYEKKRRAN